MVVGNIGSFSFDVTQRILYTLHEDGSSKKTALATKTRLNYNVCLRYIKMLKVLGWLEIGIDVSITETGRNVLKRLMSETTIDFKGIKTVHADPNLHKQFMDDISNQQTQKTKKKEHQHHVLNSTIMIVDDEPDVLLTYESFLSFTGFKVRTFADSYQALKAFASNPNSYDLVILDIRMENMNGLQLYQSLKAMNPFSKIIFVSALDAAKELTSIFSIDPENVIKKPVEKETFMKAVLTSLEK
jgi:CheY-like chemotaxis protein/predicted transcriptional regulator